MKRYPSSNPVLSNIDVTKNKKFSKEIGKIMSNMILIVK